MTNLTITEIPGYLAGSWTVDPVHSDVSFIVRHMMVSKLRGHFERFSGQIVTGGDPLESTVTATVDAASLNTNNAQRDDHIRSADFLEVDQYPTLEFRSTSLRAEGADEYALEGDLTVHGVTRPVTFELELNGFTADPFGGYRTGFSATTDISRSDFGVSINLPMEGGGVVVADKIQIRLEIEAVLDTPAS
ncbi:MAG: YceI family protein [Acidimicrobiales bacterium]